MSGRASVAPRGGGEVRLPRKLDRKRGSADSAMSSGDPLEQGATARAAFRDLFLTSLHWRV